MEAVTIIEAIASLISSLAPLARQALDAHNAGDQATLDEIHRQVVAMSDALAPAGAVVVKVVD